MKKAGDCGKSPAFFYIVMARRPQRLVIFLVK